MSTIVLLDADILAYRIGYVCQKETWTVTCGGKVLEFAGKAKLNEFVKQSGIDLDGCEVRSTSSVEPLANALHSVKLVMQSIMERTKADELVPVLSGGASWREHLALRAPYKANRWSPERIEKERHGFWSAWLLENAEKIKAQPKPVHWQAIRDYLTEYHGAVVTENGLEADDWLGMAATRLKEEGHCPIIATVDKDMAQIPGLYYHIEDKELYEISADQAMGKFYSQLMTGDRTDNIPGIPGIGEGLAEKFLAFAAKNHIPPLSLILDLYVTRAHYEGHPSSAAVGAARFNETANLVWILRHPYTPWYSEPENRWEWRGLCASSGAILPNVDWNNETGRIVTTDFFSEPADDKDASGSGDSDKHLRSPGGDGKPARKGSRKSKAKSSEVGDVLPQAVPKVEGGSKGAAGFPQYADDGTTLPPWDLDP